MTKPAFDFRHLSVSERLELIEQIWDSIVEAARSSPRSSPALGRDVETVIKKRGPAATPGRVWVIAE